MCNYLLLYMNKLCKNVYFKSLFKYFLYLIFINKSIYCFSVRKTDATLTQQRPEYLSIMTYISRKIYRHFDYQKNITEKYCAKVICRPCKIIK